MLPLPPPLPLILLFLLLLLLLLLALPVALPSPPPLREPRFVPEPLGLSQVNIGSINGHGGQSDLPVYSCTKGALVTMTKHAAWAVSNPNLRQRPHRPNQGSTGCSCATTESAPTTSPYDSTAILSESRFCRVQTMFLNEVSLLQVGWMFTPAEHKLMTEWCDATTRAARTRTTRWWGRGWRGVQGAQLHRSRS